MSTTSSPIDRLRELGGELHLDPAGEKIRYRIPPVPEARECVREIRENREAIIALLKDAASKPPLLAEVKASLSPAVHLLSYKPKQAPFVVTTAALVTNAGKFYRAYLADLARRVENPEGYHCPPLADILSKLADAGMELKVEHRPTEP